MSRRDTYSPGPANVATVERSGDEWKLVVVREFKHTPDQLWDALTQHDQLREWAPFDSDGDLGSTGATANLTTVGAPGAPAATTVTRADRPKLLEYKWGHFDMRWELTPSDQGVKLTLWTNIPKKYIAMGAAGWQLCFDVLDSHLDGDPIGRLVAQDAMQFEGWQRLNREYSEKFGIESVSW